MNLRASYRTSYSNPLLYLRSQFIRVLAIICIAASAIEVVVQLLASSGFSFGIAGTLSLTFLSGIALLLVQRDQIYLASLLLLTALSMTILVVDTVGSIMMLAVIVIISGASLTSTAIYLMLNLIVFGRLFAELFAILQQARFEYTPEVGVIISITSALIIVSAATRFFTVTAERTTTESTRSADLLQATADIGQITANLLNLDELFNRAVELIRDRFAFYHVQIFMVDDDRKFAELVASTGEIGQRLLKRGHKLAVGSQSVIGRVTQIGEVVIAHDTDSDVIYAINELLPNTRSELALPIVDGERIIGALDVQSTRRNAFSSIDIQALQVMANQLATSIRNARLFEQKELNVQLNQRLLLETRTNLREIQRLNSQLSRKAWDDYHSVKEQQVGVKLEDNAFETQVDWTPEMIEAVNNQQPVSRVEGDERVTAVPIVLRGEVLGAIEVASDDIRENDLAEMVQAVAQNLATSLESARLFEEAQEAAAQEQRINAIVEQYQSATTVDELLKITVDELSKTLGSDQSVIRLGVAPPTINVKHNGNTQATNGSTKHG